MVRFKFISANYNNLQYSIKELFDSSNNTIFQKRNTLKIIDYNNQKIVIKSFKIPNYINKIAYRYFRDSKAKRSYLNSIKLQELGVNTPAPIGYVEFGKFVLQESFYISELFEYNFEIRAVLNDSGFENREQILKEFVAFSYDLHNKGVYHIDYSPGNVLIKKEDTGYKFAIVDVNRMKFINFSDELRFKNLSRFSTSLEDLEFIAKEYAKVSGINEKYAKDILLKYHNKHQEYLQNKKRLKALKGK